VAEGIGQDAYVAERLVHLGIVAGVCREIGLAAWLDAQDEQQHERVSVGTATVAMILNGLGFSNRRLYLVPQFFATKAVERLLGPGITADDLNDDCLGRALDWLYAHDPTTLFAGIALRARRAFGISTRQVHVDTTSFAVTGEYAADLDAHTLAVTYGYSRDHRADLKQWMLALATTRQGDVPLFCQTLDGNASDKVSLLAVVEALCAQLRAASEAADEAPIFVADSGLYSAENVKRLSAAGVRWISRVPDTSKEARTALVVADDRWQQEGDLFWASAPQAPTGERWLVVRTTQGEERTHATLRRQVEKKREQWEKALWHLGNQRFACAPDAHAALTQHFKKQPAWLIVQTQLVEHAKHAQPGRPRTGVSPNHTEWQVVATLAVDEAAVTQAVRRQAAFLVATNVLDPTQPSDQELIQTYKDQHSVERGFAFLKDPLFLASSVSVKNPSGLWRSAWSWCCACSSTGSPSTAYASGWWPLVRRSPTRSRSRRTGPRCAGCSSASRASSCCTSATGRVRSRRSSCASRRCTSRSSPCSGRPSSNSTNRVIDRADCGE
jgi:transposase